MGVVVQDEFTEGTDTVLSSHTPTTTGTSWVREEISGTEDARADGDTDDLRTNDEENTHVLYTSRPDPTDADVDVEITANAITPFASPFYILARFQGVADWYGVSVNYGALDEVRLWKHTTAGGLVQLGTTQTSAISSGDKLKLQIRGDDLDVFVDTGTGWGTAIISVTDTAHQSAGGAGIMFGNRADDDWKDEGHRFDDYKVTEFAANVSISIGKGTLNLTGRVPVLSVSDNKTVAVGKATLTLTGKVSTVQETQNVTIAVGAGSLASTGKGPTVSVTDHKTIGIPVGSLSAVGKGPNASVSDHKTISVPAGSLTLTGKVPSLDTAFPIPAGLLAFAGNAPTVAVSDNRTVAVANAALNLTGKTPSIVFGTNISIGNAALTLAGKVPEVAVTDHKTIAVPAGSLTLTGKAPSLDTAFPIPAGSLTLTGKVPTVAVSDNKTVGVANAALNLTGKASSIVFGINFSIGNSGLSITGTIPVVLTGLGVTLQIPVGNIVAQGKVPIVQGLLYNPSELRTLVLNSENRALKINFEDRELAIDYENRNLVAP